jgi:hypothetical protein
LLDGSVVSSSVYVIVFGCNVFAQANVIAGTAIPLEERDIPTKGTPFKGRVTLYAAKGCESPLILKELGVTQTSLAVTEGSCSDDTLLGLGLADVEFESYQLEVPGDHIDQNAVNKPKTPKSFFAGAYSKQGCADSDLLLSSRGILSSKDQRTKCVDVGSEPGRSFIFARIYTWS